MDVAPVGGGITGTKWRLRLADGTLLALRWSDPEHWGATGAEHVRREALGCRLLAGAEVAAPRLLAHDPDGSAVGGPANLMTWCPGRVRLDHLAPAAVDSWARAAVVVHARAVPADQRPPVFTFRGPSEPEVPGWARRPGLWAEAIARRAAGPPPTAYGLLHRDFHLGNVVWESDAVSGVVDWAETSWGPPDLDVAHACADLAMLDSTDAAVAFRAAYVAQGGRLDPDPDAWRFWLAADVLGFLPDPEHVLPAFAIARPDVTATGVRQGLEDLLARTLA